MSAKELLARIVELDAKIAQLRDEFDEIEPADQVAAIEALFGRELGAIGAEDPVSIPLVRAADMLVPLGAAGAAVLAKGLAHANADVRRLAGEALTGVAEDGIEAIRPAIDFAFAAGCPAAEEMPFLLAMLDDGDAPKAIAKFLESPNPDAVAAAIEALAECGDPASVPALRALLEDKRVVAVEGEDEELQEWTVGDLAAEAIEMIEEEEE